MYEFMDPTAGVNAGNDDLGQENMNYADGVQEKTPETKQERYFTQEDVNRIISERLARAEKQWQKKIEEIQRQYEEYLASLDQQYYEPEETEEEFADEYVDPYEERFRTLEEQLEDMVLEKEIEKLSAKYKDFAENEVEILQTADKDFAENEAEILQTAIDYGITDLEKAYKLWKAENFQEPDIEAIKRQAIEEYLAQKRQQSGTLPSPEGSGGGIPAGGRQIKTFDEAKKAALARLLQNQ